MNVRVSRTTRVVEEELPARGLVHFRQPAMSINTAWQIRVQGCKTCFVPATECLLRPATATNARPRLPVLNEQNVYDPFNVESIALFLLSVVVFLVLLRLADH